MLTTTSRTYGWIPDIPDHRDHVFAAMHTAQQLPPKVDLHLGCPPVYDQGQLGSCTAHALAGGYDFERRRQNLPFLTPSRLFVYYNERVIEGTVSEDDGAQLRDGMKAIASQGMCPETMWPYEVKNFAQKPTAACYQTALQHKTVQYSRVPQDLTSMKSCLASGFPFALGFTVFQSFESDQVAKTGKVPMPAPDDPQLGGHAVLVVGYSDASSRFLVRNSWGAGWGINGYFTLPYAYATDPDLASDFWTIRLVE